MFLFAKQFFSPKEVSTKVLRKNTELGGGFKYFLCSYLWKMIQFDEHMFQIAWSQPPTVFREKNNKNRSEVMNEKAGWASVTPHARRRVTSPWGKFHLVHGISGILLQGWPTYQHLPGKYSGSQAKGLHKSGTQRGKRDVWERCVGVEKKGWVKKKKSLVFFLTPRKTEMTGWRNHHFR